MLRTIKYLQIQAAIAGSLLAFSCLASAAASTPEDELKPAQDLMKQHKAEAALSYLSELIKTNPSDTLAFNEQAQIYLSMKKFDLALEACNKAITLNPELSELYLTRADIAKERQRETEALTDYDKAISLSTNKAAAYWKRSQLHESRKNYEDEAADCNRALTADPKYAAAYASRGMAFAQMNDYQSGLSDENKALSLEPKQASTLWNRAFIYHALDQDDMALEDYSAAIEIDPEYSKSYLPRAKIYYKLGQYQNQIDDLTRLISIEPRASAFSYRAGAYYRIGRFEEALADCNRALAIDPQNVTAQLTAACLYEEMHSYNKAIEFRTKLSDSKTSTALELSRRAEDYELLGKPGPAQADWQKAFAIASTTDKQIMQSNHPLVDFDHSSTAAVKEAINNQLKGKALVLPFHYALGQPCVAVRINEHDLQMALDTGCSISAVANLAIKDIAKVTPSQLTYTKANGHSYTPRFCRAENFKLGDLKLHDVFLIVDDSFEHPEFESGLLGGNILENFIVTVDYADKKVMLSTALEPGPEKSKGTVTIPMILRGQAPHCIVRLDNKLDVLALIDTGAPNSRGAQSLLKPVLQLPLKFADYELGPILDHINVERVQLSKISLGNADFKAPLLNVYQKEQAPRIADKIVLGSDFLGRFKSVTFDYPARRIIFKPGHDSGN